jgi:hypothetical protein
MKAVALVLLGMCSCLAPASRARSRPADATAVATVTSSAGYDAAAGDARELLAALVASDTSNPTR